MKNLNPLFFRTCTVVVTCCAILWSDRATAQPSNDNFANAIELTGPSASGSGSNEGATRQANEPTTVDWPGNPRTTLGGHSVWWKWTAPQTALFTIKTGDKAGVLPSSTFDTQLGVYTGSTVGNLTEVASNDNHIDFAGGLSQVTFKATAGTTYRILVDGAQGELGTVFLYIIRTRYTLGVNISPESLASLSIDPAMPEGGYLPGTPVTLFLDTTNTFFGWSGATNSRANPLSIIIRSNTLLTAHFESDSKIFWARTNGQSAAWYMNNTNHLSAYLIGLPVTNWTLRAVADMDGNGDEDLLFQGDQGELGIWLMEGESRGSAGSIGTATNGWRLAAAGRFNGDSSPDLVFQHDDGRVAIWLMDGFNRTQAVGVGRAAAGWKVKAVADYNTDGWSDILFQHTDGRVAIWQMDGTTKSTVISLPTPSAGWHLVAVKDYDDNGQPDLLFESEARRLGIWFMNGVTRSGTVILKKGKQFKPGWHVVGVSGQPVRL